jgi:hypothetical protein
MNNQPALPFLSFEQQQERRTRGLAVLVNLENELKRAESKHESSGLELQIASRRRLVIEYKKLGLRILEIQQAIAEKTSVTWSETTIKRDLSSITAEEELEELNRQQYRDIARESDSKVRMEYRDRQIERLMPRKSPEVQVNVANQIKVEKDVTSNLLAEYEQIVAASVGAEAGDLQADRSGESVHKAEADGKASKISVS